MLLSGVCAGPEQLTPLIALQGWKERAHLTPQGAGNLTVQQALAASMVTLNFPCLIAVSSSYLFCNGHFSKRCGREKT